MTIRHAHQRNEALCKHRRNKNWNQYVAAQVCYVNLATYKAWERGRYRPSLPRMWRLSEVFEATAEELGFELTEEEQEEWSVWELLNTLREAPLPPRAQALQEEIAARAAERRAI